MPDTTSWETMLSTHESENWTRRKFLAHAGAAAGAGLIGLDALPAHAEPPPEVSSIRVVFDFSYPILCYAPLPVAKEFLHLEGFSDVQYVNYDGAPNDTLVLADGRADIAANVGSDLVVSIDKGVPAVALGGLHLGCSEVFASERVENIRDLAGKRLLASGEGIYEHVFLSSLMAFIGLDPARDVEWVFNADYARWPEMLATGAVDIVQAFPPMSFLLHDMKVGHVILNTTLDDPWRNLYCCMVVGRSDFVRQYPVAAKRAVRALVKANQLCDRDREGTARRIVEMGITDNQKYALKTLDEVPFGAWREYDPRDTLRFYALRLREANLIESGPRQILERGTNFSFLDEIRRELKT